MMHLIECSKEKHFHREKTNEKRAAAATALSQLREWVSLRSVYLLYIYFFSVGITTQVPMRASEHMTCFCVLSLFFLVHCACAHCTHQSIKITT